MATTISQDINAYSEIWCVIYLILKKYTLQRGWEALKYDVLKIICYSKQYNLECFIELAFVGREKNKK